MGKTCDALQQWQDELRAVIQPEKQAILSSFFKCGKGQYGEGDIFLGITVPNNRAISSRYSQASLSTIEQMLQSPYHEFRLAALIALVRRFERCKANDAQRSEIVQLYLKNTPYINNWDLVDLSCPKIIGPYQLAHPEADILHSLSRSSHLWEQRIAIVSTWSIIRAGRYDYTPAIAERFLTHSHDLIHKATGWMLREVGKHHKPTLLGFLSQHAHRMPRTALRYAIERLSPAERTHWLAIKKTE
jgi:3-methyladenine DNA glycosylase AlkD